MKKIPFHIVSGFLGSGKTTFLKRLIEQYASDQKIGIIQNEFAPANIDGGELKRTGKNFQLLEINNGSVFCMCLMGSFTRLLEKFIDEHHPDVLIIEASGLSDTTSIAEVLSAGKLADKIYLAYNWCIVDAENFSKVGLMRERVNHQLRMADEVIVNKMDLISGKPEYITNEIRKLNPFAEVRYTSHCIFDIKLGSNILPKFYIDSVQPMPRPNVNSMLIKTSRKVSRQGLQNFLEEWASKAYRIKGYISLKDGGMAAVQCTFDTVKIVETEKSLYPTELIALTDQFTLREWSRAFKQL